MSAAAIKAGEAFWELTIRDKTEAGLARAKARLDAFKSSLALGASVFGAFSAVVTAVVAPIAAAAKMFADVGSELHDMSQRTGLAADNLSELKFAAEQTGASIQDVERALRFMAKQGIDVKKFDQVLLAVSQIADESERAAAAQKLFGRGGTALLAMAGELPALRAQSRQLMPITPEMAALADDLGDSFGALKWAMLGLTIQVGATVAPMLILFADGLTNAVVGLRKFTEKISQPSIFTGVLKGIGAGFKGALGIATGGQQVGGGKFKSAFPDFGDIFESKAGGSQRGQFGGFRAEALGIGSGGGTLQKLDDIKKILERIKVAAEANVKATEDIEGEKFS